MGIMIDMAGRTFGRLTALHRDLSPRAARGRNYWWVCKCSCGNVKSICGSDLRNGDTQSCGCLDKECRAARAGNRTRTHGRSSTRMHNIWDSMIQRCHNPNCKDYPRYGGRGISVCDRWRASFVDFAADMGEAPTPKHSIDRWPNNDGNYEPNNCRWATAKEQARNHSGNRMVCIGDEVRCLLEWCEVLDMRLATVRGRMDRGWPVERALTTPADQQFNWRKAA